MPNENKQVKSKQRVADHGEVFTAEREVNAMLDLVKQETERIDSTFLDPATKSGVFLREIAKRLMVGLEKQIPDVQERVDHIFKKQLFGIAITELTSLLSRRSLYCSKYPNSFFSITKFEKPEGNILYRHTQHTWQDGKCIFCGTAKTELDRGGELETHAYEFIHTSRIEELSKMKFDVIISNPPYQLSDGGNGVSAKPIYQLFVDKAKRLNPRYLTMIIPARWYAGGKGLDDFRTDMLHDKRVRKLVDFENSDEVFKGVDIAGGICYFLWDRDHTGNCEVINHYDGVAVPSERSLDEYDVFIRHGKALSIIHKATTWCKNEKNAFLDDRVSARKPFGLPTNYIPYSEGIPCWFIQKIGLKYAKKIDVSDTNGYLSKWKLLVPPAPIAGQTDFSKPVGFYYFGNTRIAKPGECCTESYIVAGAFDTEEETLAFRSYLFTKLARFLLLQTVVSQHVTKKNFCFVPDLGHYSGEYTDRDLCTLWGITEDEWNFIDSKISTVTETGFLTSTGGDE